MIGAMVLTATGNLNHLGRRNSDQKSAINYQNKKRSWVVFILKGEP
ncbi:MAG: hypothetical protein ACJA1B_000248 [Polaribacter sp.]|jgi:hypothetical protein